MDLPYTVEELRSATHEVMAANGLASCYIRPLAFYGFGELGVSSDRETRRRRDHQLPLGRVPRRGQPDEGHHGEDLELGARRPERHPARREGDRDLPQLDARDDGGAPRRLRRGDHALARRVRRRRAGREHLRRQGRRPLHAAARDVDPARDHARHGHPRSPRISAIASRRRCSSAPTSTSRTRCSWSARRPRSPRCARSTTGDRRRPGDARAAEGIPRHGQRARTSVGATGSTWSRCRRPRRSRRGGRPDDRALVPLARRARGGARRRRPPLGAALARADDRPLRGGVRRGGRRAVRSRGLERDGGPPPAVHHGRGRARGRGRSPRRTPSSRRRTARSTRARRRSSPTSTGARSISRPPRSRRRSRIAREPSSPSTSTATRASSTSSARSATRAGSRSIEDACEALGARYKGAPVGSQGPSAVFAFYPNKQITTGEGGMVTTHSESEWRLLEACATRVAPTPAAGSSTRGSASTTGSTTCGRRSASASSRSSTTILAGRAAVAARYAELLGVDPGARASVRGRRRSRALVVRLRRHAAGRSGSRSRHRVARRSAACRRRATSRASTSSRTCRSGSDIRVGLCPVAEEMASRTLALPFHARLAEDDQEYVADALRDSARSSDAPALPRRGALRLGDLGAR